MSTVRYWKHPTTHDVMAEITSDDGMTVVNAMDEGAVELSVGDYYAAVAQGGIDIAEFNAIGIALAGASATAREEAVAALVRAGLTQSQAEAVVYGGLAG